MTTDMASSSMLYSLQLGSFIKDGSTYQLDRADENIQAQLQTFWQVAVSPDGELIACLQVGKLTSAPFSNAGAISSIELPIILQLNPDQRVIRWSTTSSLVMILASNGYQIHAYSDRAQPVTCFDLHSLLETASIGIKFAGVDNIFSSPFPPKSFVGGGDLLHAVYGHNNSIGIITLAIPNGEVQSTQCAYNILPNMSKLARLKTCRWSCERESLFILHTDNVAEWSGTVILTEWKCAEFRAPWIPMSTLTFDSGYFMSIVESNRAQTFSQQTSFLANVGSLFGAMRTTVRKNANHREKSITIDISPHGRWVVILEASEYITVVERKSEGQFCHIFINRAHLSDYKTSVVEDFQGVGSAVHFLSESTFAMVSTQGDIVLFGIDPDVPGVLQMPMWNDPAIVGHRGYAPRLGPSASAALPETPTRPPRLVLLRCLDSQTGQLFVMEGLSPEQSVIARIAEDRVEAAYALADTCGLGSQFVLQTRWKLLRSKVYLSDNSIFRGEANITASDTISIADTIKSIFHDSSDAAWVVQEALSIVTLDANVWTVVLDAALERVGEENVEMSRNLEDRKRRLCLLTALLRKLTHAQSPSLLNRKQSMECYSINLEENNLLAVANVSDVINNSEFSAVSDSGDRRRGDGSRFAEFETFCRLVRNPRHPCTPEVDRSISLDSLLVSVRSFVSASILSIATLLARRAMLHDLTVSLSLFPKDLLPYFLALLSCIPLLVDVTAYCNLLPVVIVDAAQDFSSNDHGRGEWRVLGGDGNVETLADMLYRSTRDDVDTGKIFARSSLLVLRKGGCAIDIGADEIVAWYIGRVMAVDAVGFSSLASTFATAAVTRVRTDAKTAALSVLFELNNQLSHFSRLLYNGLLENDLKFSRWVMWSSQKKIEACVSASSRAGISLTATIKYHVTPLFEGASKLWNMASPSSFFALTKIRSVDITDEIKVSPNWSHELALSLAKSIGVGDLHAVSDIADIADQSKPTLKVQERLIKDVLALATMVVHSFVAYDDFGSKETAKSSMSILWRLVESTPAKLPGKEESVTESVVLTKQLDILQATLVAADIISDYVSPPVLSLLMMLLDDKEEPLMLPVYASLYDTRYSNCDILTDYFNLHASSISDIDISGVVIAAKAMQSRACVQSLLRGCGFLLRDVETALSSNTTGNCADSLQRPAVGSVTSVEALSNVVSLEEAIALRMCAEHGAVFNAATSDAEAHWLKLLRDLRELCDCFFSSDLSHPWLGHVFVMSMLHFSAETVYQVAHRDVLLFEAGGMTDDGADDFFGAILCSLGVKASDMDKLLMYKCSDLFNSMASSDKVLLDQCKTLAQMLCPDDTVGLSPSIYDGETVIREIALCELAALVGYLSAPLVPMQLRLMSPVEIIRTILDAKPSAYYELDGLTSADIKALQRPHALDSTTHDGNNRTIDNSDLFNFNFRDRNPFPGGNLIQIISAAKNPVSVEASISMQIVVLKTALAVGDVLGAYCVSCSVLSMLADYRKSTILSQSLDSDVKEAACLVIAMINSDTDSSESNRGRADENFSEHLRKTLTAFILSAVSEDDLTIFPLSYGDKNTAWCRRSASEERDTHLLDLGKDALLKNIGELLTRRADPSCIAAPLSSVRDIISAAPSARSGSRKHLSGTAQDALAFFLTLSKPSLALTVLDALGSDLEKKIGSLLSTSSRQLKPAAMAPNRSLNESFVTLLMQKGFSRNGAKRAVLATNSSSLDRALIWAVEHCSDEDFERPLAQNVSGALLSEDSMSHFVVRVEDVSAALLFVEGFRRIFANCVGIELPAAVGTETNKKKEEEEETDGLESVSATNIEGGASLSPPAVENEICLVDSSGEQSIRPPDATLIPPLHTTLSNRLRKMTRLQSVLATVEDVLKVGLHPDKLASGIIALEPPSPVSDADASITYQDREKRETLDVMFEVVFTLAIARDDIAYDLLPEILRCLPSACVDHLVAIIKEFTAIALGESEWTTQSSSKAFLWWGLSTIRLLAALHSVALFLPALSHLPVNARKMLVELNESTDQESSISMDHVYTSMASKYPDRLFKLLWNIYGVLDASKIRPLELVKKAAADVVANSISCTLCPLCLADTKEGEEATGCVCVRDELCALLYDSEDNRQQQPQFSRAGQGQATILAKRDIVKIFLAPAMMTTVVKQLREDVALLRRLARIEDSKGISGKILLPSDSLVALGPLVGQSAAENNIKSATPHLEISEERRFIFTVNLASRHEKALVETASFLSLSNIALWVRTVGRALRTTSSEMHLLYACSLLHKQRVLVLHASVFADELVSIFKRLDVAHVCTVALLIAGISPQRYGKDKSGGVGMLTGIIRSEVYLILRGDSVQLSDKIGLSDSLIDNLLSSLSETVAGIDMGDSSATTAAPLHAIEASRGLSLIVAIISMRHALGLLPQPMHETLKEAFFSFDFSTFISLLQSAFEDSTIAAEPTRIVCDRLIATLKSISSIVPAESISIPSFFELAAVAIKSFMADLVHQSNGHAAVIERSEDFTKRLLSLIEKISVSPLETSEMASLYSSLLHAAISTVDLLEIAEQESLSESASMKLVEITLFKIVVADAAHQKLSELGLQEIDGYEKTQSLWLFYVVTDLWPHYAPIFESSQRMSLCQLFRRLLEAWQSDLSTTEAILTSLLSDFAIALRPRDDDHLDEISQRLGIRKLISLLRLFTANKVGALVMPQPSTQLLTNYAELAVSRDLEMMPFLNPQSIAGVSFFHVWLSLATQCAHAGFFEDSIEILMLDLQLPLLYLNDDVDVVGALTEEAVSRRNRLRDSLIVIKAMLPGKYSAQLDIIQDGRIEVLETFAAGDNDVPQCPIIAMSWVFVLALPSGSSAFTQLALSTTGTIPASSSSASLFQLMCKFLDSGIRVNASRTFLHLQEASFLLIDSLFSALPGQLLSSHSRSWLLYHHAPPIDLLLSEHMNEKSSSLKNMFEISGGLNDLSVSKWLFLLSPLYLMCRFICLGHIHEATILYWLFNAYPSTCLLTSTTALSSLRDALRYEFEHLCLVRDTSIWYDAVVTKAVDVLDAICS